jgi:capsular exopolysaccharide synthesis family protein
MNTMNNNPINQQQVFVEEDNIDIRKILYALRKGWYLLLIFPLITGISAYFYLRYTVPQYEVKGSILIKSEDRGGLSTEMLSQELMGFTGGFNADVADEATILQSRSIMEEVVMDLKLQSDIYGKGRFMDADLYGNSPIRVDTFILSGGGVSFDMKVLNPKEYLLIREEQEYRGVFDSLVTNEYGSFLLSYNPGASSDDLVYRVNFSNIFNTVLKYQSKLKVSYEEGSSVLTLSMTDVVPQRCEDIINKVIDRYNLAAIEDKNATGRNTLEFIDDRLLIITDELQSVEKGVQKVKEREGITVNPESDLGYLYGEIGQYGQRLTDLEVKRKVVASLDEYLNQDKNKYELIPLDLVESPILAELSVQLNGVILERKRLLQIVTQDYPGVRELEAQVENFRLSIQRNIKKIQDDVNDAITKIKSRVRNFEAQLRKTPEKERQLLEVKRQQFVKENLYLFLLEKREETAISLAATTDNARIIDYPALAQLAAVSPKRSRILALGLMLGLALAIGLILLREFLKDTIQSQEEIKSITQVPILGAIAQSTKPTNVVVTKSSRSTIAEMFRLLRTNLQFTLAGEPHKTMLVTSSMSGEGKTFICINLAMSFALSGKKVLAIGLDMRKPKLAAYLTDTVPTKGMSSYLIGAAGKAEIINVYKGNENFHFIASGPIPPNPSELIMNGRLETLVRELKQEYDVIIFDTPPVGFVTDSLLLKSMVNASLYVVRHNYTKREQLKLIDQLYREQKFNNPAIILNAIQRGRGYGEGSGYG